MTDTTGTAPDPMLNPVHYGGFSHGSESIDILEHLTGNGHSSAKYIIRSCRLDKNLIKGNPQQDLGKAIWFAVREMTRQFGPEATASAVVEALDGSKISVSDLTDLTPARVLADDAVSLPPFTE